MAKKLVTIITILGTIISLSSVVARKMHRRLKIKKFIFKLPAQDVNRIANGVRTTNLYTNYIQIRRLR
jgi:hypothetical protein